jgi:hypothetical protein
LKKQDPSAVHEERMGTDKELEYRVELSKYFQESVGNDITKLQNFAKYVPRQVLARFLSKYELFKRIVNVQGSIIEGGVLRGGGLMSWAQLSAILEPVNHQRKIIGFDTFAGFTDLSEEDKKGVSEFSKKGGLAVDSFADLKACIELYDMNRFIGHIEKVRLIKGDVKTTIPAYLEDNPHTVVSLLYLDFDVFEPTKVAIENFLPRMPKGAVLAFDELNIDSWPGEVMAVMNTIGINNLRIRRFRSDSVISYAVIE